MRMSEKFDSGTWTIHSSIYLGLFLVFSLFVVGCSGPADQAKSYLETGQPLAAIEVLETYVDENPTNSYAWEQLGHAYFHQGEYGSAGYAYRVSLAQSGTKDPSVLYKLGVAEFRAGNYDTAVNIMQETLRLHDNRAKVSVKLGEMMNAMGFGSEAQRYFSRALKNDTGNVQAMTHLAEISLNAGDVDRTRQYVNRALEVDTTDSRPRMVQARLALAEGETKRVQGILEPVMNKWPTDPQVNVLMARSYDNANQPEQARRYYRRALFRNFGSSSLHDEYGRFLMVQDRDTVALQHFNWALNRNENNVQAYYHRGVLFDRLGQYQAAVRDYRAVLERNQNHLRALNNLGVIYLQQNQPEQALSLFRRAVQVEPGYTLASLNIARALNQQGDTDEAEEILGTIIENNPEDSSAAQRAQSLLDEWS